MGLLGGDESVEDIILDIRVRTRNAAKEMRDYVKGASNDLVRGLKPAIEENEQAMNQLGNTGQVALGSLLAGGIMKVIGLVTELASKLGQMAFDFISQGVQMNATVQTLMVSLTTMLGSEEAALALMGRMRERAAAIGQDPIALRRRRHQCSGRDSAISTAAGYS
jgi:hypothetical protein